MFRYCQPIVLLSLIAALTACGGADDSAQEYSTDPQGLRLVKLSLTPPVSSTPKGMRTTFSVTGIYSDSSTKDLTGLAQWQIKSPTIAETSTEEAGAFKGLETGSTQIRASYLGLETSASLTVSSATLSSLEIRPKFSDEKSFIHGTSLALQAIGHFSDSTSRDLSTQVSWNESEPSVEISDNGLLSTLGASPDSDVSFLVNASHPDLSSSSALQIKLIPDSITDLQLLGSYDDIHLHGERSVQVYANYSSGRAVNVSSETSIENSAPNTLDVKLDSSNSVLLIGKSSGDALLSFTFLEKKLEETITVNSSTLSQLVIESGGTTLDMVLGERRSLKAAAYFTDGKIEDVSKSVLWTSSDERLLHVSNNEIHRGELSALGLGNARVSSSLNGLSTELDVKVNPLDVNRLEVSPVQKHLLQGSKSPFKATAIISGYSPFDVSALPELTWTSNNSDVANVSNLEENKGLVSSNLNTSGDLVISVEYAGVTASSSLQVHSADELASIRIESSPSVIHLGQRHTYKAFGYFNDGSRTEISDLVRWISKETKIMESVPGSAPGTFRAKTTGTTTIHALYKNFSAQFPVDVLNGSLSQITVTPEADSFIVSTAHQLKAYAHYFSSELNINYKVDITDQARWSTTTPLVGTFPKPLSSPGLTYTLAPGSLEVEASFGTQTAVQTYTVVENFSSLEIESTLTTLEYSLPQQFKAYAVRADGSRIDVTHAAEWWTSVPDIVHIDNTFNSAGLATAIQKKTGGSAVINARFHSINASKEVSLSYDALRPISIAMNSDVDTVLSDGIDKANIAIKVFALGPQSVINDGTGIKVHIYDGASELSSYTLNTSNGSVNLDVSCETNTRLQIKAYLELSPEIETSGYLNCTTNFKTLFAKSGIALLDINNLEIQAGSKITMNYLSITNRLFDVLSFTFRDTETVLIYIDDNPELLSSYILSAGEKLSYTHTFDTASPLKTYEMKFRLRDQRTGREFDLPLAVIPQ